MIRDLMSSRRFAPLFWAQFFSALNDNVLKNALVIILLYSAATGHGDALVTVAGAVFIFPYFILSGLGGQLADKYVKSVVARRLKFAEIFAAGLCRRRLLPALGAAAVCSARAVRHHRRPVRPREILHAAGPTRARRARDRQRAGRRRHLHGHPARHRRRRPVRGRLRAYGLGRIGRGRARPVVLGLRLAHSADNAICPRSACQRQSLDLDARPAEDAARRPPSVGRHRDRLVVLAGRRHRAVAAAGAGQGRRRWHRGRGDAVPRDLRDRHCHRLAVRGQPEPRPPEPRAGADRRHHHGVCRPRSRLGHRRDHQGSGHRRGRLRNLVRRPAHADRLRRLRIRRWLVRRSVLCCRPGVVGTVRARPHHRRRQRAASRLHGGRLAVRRAVAGGWPPYRLDLLRPRRRQLRRGVVRADQMGQGRRARFRRAAVPRAVPHRGPRAREPAAAGHAHADRAQPCQPDRRPAAARRAADRRQLRCRYRHLQGLVGQAVPAGGQALHHGSDQAAGRTRPDQARRRRRAGGHLPGRAHHGLRLADEGL